MRAPVFAITATLSLAVGIGCNAAIFTIVDHGQTTNTGAALGMSVLLAVVSLTGIYVPARAATRLDSVRAIRYEWKEARPTR